MSGHEFETLDWFVILTAILIPGDLLVIDRQMSACFPKEGDGQPANSNWQLAQLKPTDIISFQATAASFKKAYTGFS
jgi:hypothetical protein